MVAANTWEHTFLPVVPMCTGGRLGAMISSLYCFEKGGLVFDEHTEQKEREGIQDTSCPGYLTWEYEGLPRRTWH